MAEPFVPLASFVRGLGSLSQTPAQPAAHAEPLSAPRNAVEITRGADDSSAADIVQELGLMRLAAYEAFERAKGSLLASLAEHVLGRELALAPVELETLVTRLIGASRDLEPVTLVLCAADAERVRTALPTYVDPSLGVGDFIVEVRDGALESPVRFRLRAALERALAAVA